MEREMFCQVLDQEVTACGERALNPASFANVGIQVAANSPVAAIRHTISTSGPLCSTDEREGLRTAVPAGGGCGWI